MLKSLNFLLFSKKLESLATLSLHFNRIMFSLCTKWDLLFVTGSTLPPTFSLLCFVTSLAPVVIWICVLAASTQELNPCLPHCRRILYRLSHQVSPRILERVTYPFSRGSSRTRNQTRVSWIADLFFTSWATQETHRFQLFWEWN